MHIHANQVNPNTQLDLVNAAGRAAAKREVKRIRKKLLEEASRLLGEATSGEASVVSVGKREESQRETKQQKSRSGHEETTDSADTAISDWV